MAAQQPQGRNSEGVKVIRHPRSDIQDVDWIRSVTTTAYDPATGWHVPDGYLGGYLADSYLLVLDEAGEPIPTEDGLSWIYEETIPGWEPVRSPARPTLVRQTTISSAWLFANIPGVVNPALFNWQIDSLRNVRNRSLYLDGAKNPAVGNSASNDFTPPPLDPTQTQWPIDSQLVPHDPYWTSRWIGNDWLTPDIAAQFNPASQGTWRNIDSQRPQKPAEQQLICWTRSGYFVSLLDDFEFAKFPWRTDSQRVPGKPYWTNLWTGTDYIPPEIRNVFDPAQQAWVVNSQRVPAPPYWSSGWIGNDWLNPGLLGDIAYDPAKENWTIPTTTYQSRAWWSDSPQPQAWMVPSVQFDPRLWPATHVDSQRYWPKAIGRWQPDVDNAWLTENPVVPNTFNASFAEENNVLLEAGSVLIIPGDLRGNA